MDDSENEFIPQPVNQTTSGECHGSRTIEAYRTVEGLFEPDEREEIVTRVSMLTPLLISKKPFRKITERLFVWIILRVRRPQSSRFNEDTWMQF